MFAGILRDANSEKWSSELAHKVLRYLAGSSDLGLLIAAVGDENVATQAQKGLAICWGGSVISWRSSRAALSALSTAQAELCDAALGWQVTEGIFYLLSTLHVHPASVEVTIDNAAALTAAKMGATWRAQYYAVRARRRWEEGQQGRATLTRCPHQAHGGRRPRCHLGWRGQA